jgi:hypothetical protein
MEDGLMREFRAALIAALLTALLVATVSDAAQNVERIVAGSYTTASASTDGRVYTVGVSTGISGNNLCPLNAQCAVSGNWSFSGTIVLPRFTKANTYTVDSSEPDYELCGDTSSAAVTFTMPAGPVNGRHLLFTDCNNGASSTRTIVINAAPGQTIGRTHAASFAITTAGASVGFTWNSAINNWDAH